jgi:two-component system sensor histidine kinase DesK
MILAAAVVMLMRQAMHLIRQLRVTQRGSRTAPSSRSGCVSRGTCTTCWASLSSSWSRRRWRRLAGRDPAAAAREAAEIETIGRQALAEVREAVTGYRTLALRRRTGQAEALNDAGIETVIKVADDPLPSELDDAFGWVVREAATNVIRHSRAATCHRAVPRQALDAEVRDDQGGPATPGNGLRGLRERLDEVGCTLSGVTENGYVLRATAS